MSIPLSPALRAWLPVAVAVVGTMSFAYLAVQQAYRNAADDPQVQLAQDAAARIEGREALAAIVPSGTKVDIATSPATFMVVVDQDGKPLVSSGQLDGTTPLPPHGSLTAANTTGLHRVTWQPAKGLREAAVIVPFHASATSNGYVIAARSMKEVERRESGLAKDYAAALAATLLLSFLAVRFPVPERPRR